MKRSLFLTISGILSFVFGAMMFFVPALAAQSLGINVTADTTSLLRGMGGLIIGFGTVSFLARNNNDKASLTIILTANVITHALGLSVDILGVINGTLTLVKMAGVEVTHLFIGVGSLIYLLRIRKQ